MTEPSHLVVAIVAIASEADGLRDSQQPSVSTQEAVQRAAHSILPCSRTALKLGPTGPWPPLPPSPRADHTAAVQVVPAGTDMCPLLILRAQRSTTEGSQDSSLTATSQSGCIHSTPNISATFLRGRSRSRSRGSSLPLRQPLPPAAHGDGLRLLRCAGVACTALSSRRRGCLPPSGSTGHAPHPRLLRRHLACTARISRVRHAHGRGQRKVHEAAEAVRNTPATIDRGVMYSCACHRCSGGVPCCRSAGDERVGPRICPLARGGLLRAPGPPLEQTDEHIATCASPASSCLPTSDPFNHTAVPPKKAVAAA
jgi:hypothetical protein